MIMEDGIKMAIFLMIIIIINGNEQRMRDTMYNYYMGYGHGQRVHLRVSARAHVTSFIPCLKHKIAHQWTVVIGKICTGHIN